MVLNIHLKSSIRLHTLYLNSVFIEELVSWFITVIPFFEL
uniref:Uncharacterized protein n=1 Tax=Rhizophora mucronata TaxID=61149 RepID=A0A2P2PCN4_RHIMU